jgi:hypothetical protein|tara:strand:+ start:1890 stop:2177 length:288 start_codon:yes stop_codon:yes gene_type:complete
MSPFPKAVNPMPKQNREFEIGDRAVSEAEKFKHGTVVGKEQRKQRARSTKKGYSTCSYLKVKWDIRSVAESVMQFRVIPESELEMQLELFYHETD